MSFVVRRGKRWRRAASAMIICLLVITVESAAPPAARAADATGNAYASIAADYRQGDFGTSVNTELYSLTPEFGYVSDSYDVSASIPFHNLRVSGGGVSSSASGIGDAVLSAGRRLWRDERSRASLRGALRLKLATGDENKGLGTGATDIGFFLSATRKAGDNAFTVLAGYTEVGEPAGVTYDNVISYGVGVNHSFSRTNVFASLQGQTSALPGGTAPLECDAGFFNIMSLEYVFIAHAFVGLSNGSPDGGLGIGLVRWLR